jgi:hypothetical protein
MLEELARLHAEVPNLTVIYVTYDQSEALTIADRIGDAQRRAADYVAAAAALSDCRMEPELRFLEANSALRSWSIPRLGDAAGWDFRTVGSRRCFRCHGAHRSAGACTLTVLVALSLALARGADSHIDLAQLWLASYVLYRGAAGNAAFYAEISHGPDSTLLGIGAKIIASASPLTLDLGNIRRIEDAGGAAVVLPSLFEEQIAQAHYTRTGPEARAEAFSYLPLAAEYRTGPHEYLDLIKKARESVSVPIIASLNGVTARAGPATRVWLSRQAPVRSNLTFFYTCRPLSRRGRS